MIQSEGIILWWKRGVQEHRRLVRRIHFEIWKVFLPHILQPGLSLTQPLNDFPIIQSLTREGHICGAIGLQILLCRQIHRDWIGFIAVNNQSAWRKNRLLQVNWLLFFVRCDLVDVLSSKLCFAHKFTQSQTEKLLSQRTPSDPDFVPDKLWAGGKIGWCKSICFFFFFSRDVIVHSF